jgi:F-type H+-transporting ATPase subunit delta
VPVAGSGIARRYAEAVFEIAAAHDSFDRWSEELAAIARAQEQPEIGRLLANPAVGRPAKEGIAAEYLGEMSPEAGNLVRLLLRKGRFALAPRIAEAYRELLNEHRGIATASVVSAAPLDAAELAAVAKKLSGMTGRTVVVEPSVDPSLLGGIVARVGDQLIDASVRGRLEALKKRLATV